MDTSNSSATNEPIVKLQPGGKASILSYNVPEPTAYTGRSLIDLRLDQEVKTVEEGKAGKGYFKPEYYDLQAWQGKRAKPTGTQVAEALRTGFFDRRYFPNVVTRTNILALRAGVAKQLDNPPSNPSVPRAISDAAQVSESVVPSIANPALEAVGLATPVRKVLAQIDPETVATRIAAGERLNVYRNLHGDFSHNFLPEPQAARPRLMLVEVYKLSSFLGNYGAGRTIKTFTLLPGEKTKISIKTYTKTTTDLKSASSILDSFTEESAQSFEKDVRDEQSDQRNQAESDEWYVDAEASGGFNIGIASADVKVKGGYKGSSNSAREQFTKNVTDATQKHSSRASAKRDVQINTSYETKAETGEETSIEREIENINVSRTLNFVFRQMNQEFITLFHLVDVRIGFFNGFGESAREVPLYKLDSLLDEVMVDDNAKKEDVRQLIIGELENIFDYKDEPQSFIERRELIPVEGQPPATYLRVKKNLITTYTDDTIEDGLEIKVPGVLLAANKYTMRTDGVIVEALLGQADGLDEYSTGLQREAVKEKELANKLAHAHVVREWLAQQIVKDKDEESAKVFQAVFPPPPAPKNNDMNGKQGVLSNA